MLNFKQISYLTFLFILLNASHTLGHLKEPMPMKCHCPCPCPNEQTKVKATQPKDESHDGNQQVKVNATQPKDKSHAGNQQVKANATQPKDESQAGKQVTQPEDKSHAGNQQVKANATQSKDESHAGNQQVKGNATQQKDESNAGNQQVQANTTQPKDESHAGNQQVKANATQPKDESHGGNQQAKANATVQAEWHHSQQQFMKWVSFVGKLKHTTFKAATNKMVTSYTLTVDKNAALGDFTCIQDAIDSLPMINLVRVVIKVHAGVYTEKVSIPATKSFITIEGEGSDKTIIQWGDNAQTVGPGGMPLGIFGSATFAVNSPYFIAKNFTVKNTAPAPPPGAVGKQAVALRISADTASFVGCKFLGAQDTLFDHLGRHYYKDCYIEGSLGFIFGNGLSMFDNCAVHAIAGAIEAVTAQARKSILDDCGFSFVNCKVMGAGAQYLARTFSRVVFAYTYLDNISIPSKEMTGCFGQYKCSGAGANHAGRVPWSRELTDEEAKPFISLTFIDGSEWVSNI